MKKIELTILIPCLNEEDTIEKCINMAFSFLENNNIIGEVLVIDYNSIDNSYNLACRSGARVIIEETKGYGSALIRGINESKGKYILMGDADCSYDFTAAYPFLEKLREGFDFVIGNRFKGGIKNGAMPFLHKYVGNPILSSIGRVLFKIEVGDFHCGLRAFNTKKIKKLNLSCIGMDFASEMIIEAKINNFKIAEVPIILYKDERINCVSHLDTFKDGILHLKTMIKLYRMRRK